MFKKYINTWKDKEELEGYGSCFEQNCINKE
jgi:hypothetical protein